MKKTVEIASILFLSIMLFACNEEQQIKNPKLSKAEAKRNLKNQLILIQSKSSNNITAKKECGSCPNLTDKDNQKQTLNSSINVLNSFGITHEDIIDEFGSLSNPNIITTALAATRIDNQSQLGYHIVDFNTGYNYSTDTFINLNGLRSKADPSVLDCAMDALGIPAGLIVGSAKGLGRKALLKAARKLASRTLGWIGAGIAVYEFGDCMDWW